MKLLFVSGLQIFPAESGGQIRSAGLIEGLQANGIEVDVYSMVGRKRDYLRARRSGVTEVKAGIPGIREYVDRNWIWAGLQYPSYWANLPPLWITSWLSHATPPTLKAMRRHADAVIIDFPFLYPAVPPMADLKRRPKRVVLSTHNVEASLWQKAGVRSRVAEIERAAALRADRVVCCAPDDRRHFAELVGVANTLYVPNGIDPARFAPSEPTRRELREALGIAPDEKMLLFPASAFLPNVEGLEFLRSFVEREASLVERLKLRFVVAGSVSKVAHRTKGLTITGPVGKIEPYFAAADFAFNAVLRGSGTNVKMGEFMAARLPIITSEAGTRGYALVDGEDCVTYTPESLAEVLREATIFGDPELRSRMARSAFEKNKNEIDMRHAIMPLVHYLKG